MASPSPSGVMMMWILLVATIQSFCILWIYPLAHENQGSLKKGWNWALFEASDLLPILPFPRSSDFSSFSTAAGAPSLLLKPWNLKRSFKQRNCQNPPGDSRNNLPFCLPLRQIVWSAIGWCSLILMTAVLHIIKNPWKFGPLPATNAKSKALRQIQGIHEVL